MNFSEIYHANKERVVTGLVMLAVASGVAMWNNLYVTWGILGVAYLFAFHEAMKLFEVDDVKLYVYAVLVWVVALFYPYPMIWRTLEQEEESATTTGHLDIKA